MDTDHVQAPVKVQATSVGALPPAPPAGPSVSDPYEAVPFCSDLRWRKDRTHRKLSAGGTGTVYRSASCVLALISAVKEHVVRMQHIGGRALMS